MCSKLTLSGSMSPVGNSLNHICCLYGINKHNLHEINICKAVNIDVLSPEDKATASVVRDLINMKDNHCTFFTEAEIQSLITYLCTS